MTGMCVSVRPGTFFPSPVCHTRMTLASRTREAVDERPFLREGLRAGIVNYSAAARLLPVEGDDDAVATALRRYADDLPALAAPDGDVRVRMNGGLEWQEAPSEDSLLTVGDSTLAAGSDRTAIVATGTVPIEALSTVLDRLRIEDIDVDGAGATPSALVVSVPRTDGANALRIVESVFD